MRITVGEAKANFDRLLDAVRSGEQVTIIEDDRAVAVLRPPAAFSPADELKALRSGVTLGMPLRDALDQGRRY